MTDDEISIIHKLAEVFRNAIIDTPAGTRTICLERFPKGSCGDSSILLARFLHKNGYRSIRYICGERKRFSHAWLQIESLIIDITSDQFDDSKETVIVSQRSKWHKGFRIIFDRFEIFDKHDEATRKRLLPAYEEILKRVKHKEHPPCD